MTFFKTSENTEEKAILATIDYGNLESSSNLNELEYLAKTLGIITVDKVTQSLKIPSVKTYFGKGKIEYLKEIAERIKATCIIFDDEITPTQQRNIEGLINIKILDRTLLILDIFARQAHTAEGKLQVELAQLSYRLPRIRGKGIELSRLGGGIGTKGPGETKLEVDRRRIENRIGKLKSDLIKVTKRRELQRKARTKGGLFVASIVGYTNAGKSSLLNRLTSSHALVENKLFSTLDSMSRKLSLTDGTMIISDTVGFINKLPHQIISAFMSTLEEILDSSLLLHVCDASNENYDEHINVVNYTLGKIGAGNVPKINIFNKIDLLSSREKNIILERYPESILISAVTNEGISELKLKLNQALQDRTGD